MLPMLTMATSGPLNALLALKQLNGAISHVCCMNSVYTMCMLYVEFSSGFRSQNKHVIRVCIDWVAKETYSPNTRQEGRATEATTNQFSTSFHTSNSPLPHCCPCWSHCRLGWWARGLWIWRLQGWIWCIVLSICSNTCVIYSMNFFVISFAIVFLLWLLAQGVGSLAAPVNFVNLLPNCFPYLFESFSRTLVVTWDRRLNRKDYRQWTVLGRPICWALFVNTTPYLSCT